MSTPFFKKVSKKLRSTTSCMPSWHSPMIWSFQAGPPGDALRWAPFLPDEKWGKESPKAGPSPALWNPPCGTGCICVLLFSALSPWGHIDGVGILPNVSASLCGCPSIARASPWCAAVPSDRKPGSRRRKRRFSRGGPDVEMVQL